MTTWSSRTSGPTSKSSSFYVVDSTDAGTPGAFQAGAAIEIYGTALGETLFGTAGINLIYGLGGSDVLFGDAGNDTLLGGTGNDELYGGAHDDSLAGDGGNDTMQGGEGTDSYDGGAGWDTVDFSDTAEGWVVYLEAQSAESSGGTVEQLTSIEALIGSQGDDELWGTDAGSDLAGAGGDDELIGGHGNDNFSGDGGDDVLLSGGGNDLLEGGSGNDILDGSEGRDTIVGGAGEDVLRSGEGSDDDILTGGADSDMFVLEFSRTDTRTVTVTDYTAEDDVSIEVRGLIMLHPQDFDSNEDGVVDQYDEAVRYINGNLEFEVSATSPNWNGGDAFAIFLGVSEIDADAFSTLI